MTSKFLKEVTERNQMLVDTLAYEIKYICDEAVDHNHSWNEFKQSLLNRIEMEETFKNITDDL